MTEPIAYVDGALVPRREAVVSIDDAAVRYGAACFETMRATVGVPFRLADHLARLRGGLKAMRVAPPDEATLAAAVTATLEANGLLDARIRLSVSAGRMPGPDLAAGGPPSIVVVADPVSTDAAPPIALAVSSLHVDGGRPLASAKTSQYLVYLLARAEAREAGAGDALLLNAAGEVCETSTANVFAVIDGAVVTPALPGPVPGVTRAVILEIARDAGIAAQERALTIEELQRASEVFLTNSIIGTQPVESVARDGSPVWTRPGAGHITERIASEYARLLMAECGEGRTDG